MQVDAERPSLALHADTSTVAAGGDVTLTWTATGVDTCTASDGWSGSRALEGVETVTAVAGATTFVMSCSGPAGGVMRSVAVTAAHDVRVTWTAPTTNSDGSTIEDLAGFVLHVGSESGRYDTVIEIPEPDASEHLMRLDSGNLLRCGPGDRHGGQPVRSIWRGERDTALSDVRRVCSSRACALALSQARAP